MPNLSKREGGCSDDGVLRQLLGIIEFQGRLADGSLRIKLADIGRIDRGFVIAGELAVMRYAINWALGLITLRAPSAFPAEGCGLLQKNRKNRIIIHKYSFS